MRLYDSNVYKDILFLMRFWLLRVFIYLYLILCYLDLPFFAEVK